MERFETEPLRSELWDKLGRQLEGQLGAPLPCGWQLYGAVGGPIVVQGEALRSVVLAEMAEAAKGMVKEGNNHGN